MFKIYIKNLGFLKFIKEKLRIFKNLYRNLEFFLNLNQNGNF